MEIYCDKWKLDINCKKTKINTFSNDKCAEGNYYFESKGENMKIVNE